VLTIDRFKSQSIEIIFRFDFDEVICSIEKKLSAKTWENVNISFFIGFIPLENRDLANQFLSNYRVLIRSNNEKLHRCLRLIRKDGRVMTFESTS
jgi:hypothetical protein